MKTFVRDDYLKLGAPKTFADGSLSADTAAIWHTWPEDTRGNLRVPMWKPEELQKFRIDSWLRRVGNWSDPTIHFRSRLLANQDPGAFSH